MNGLSDQQEMTTSVFTWTQIRDWAAARRLARVSFTVPLRFRRSDQDFNTMQETWSYA